MPGLIGKKIGMTSVFGADGKNIPCTVIEAGPCVVTQLRTLEKDGYEAVQLAYGETTEKHTSKALQGHFEKAGTTPKKKLVEFTNFDTTQVKLGDTITLDKAIQIDATSQGGAPHGTLQPGEYNIQYVSVIDKSNNKILKVAYNSGEDIEEFVNKVAQDNNLTPDQVKYVLHLSNDSHALGWAGQENFDLNQETKFKTTEHQYTHESPISFTGDFNPIPGSNVTVNKKDAHSGMVLMDENGLI